MIVTSIKQQKKKDRVNVYLDDKFGFGIDLDNFVILNLRVGQNLNEKEVKEIIKKSEFQKTLDKLLRFAMVRPRSEKEFKDYLCRKKVPEVIWKDLFSKLKSFELSGDKKFAEWWVETRAIFRPKPKRMIEQELRIKGIDKEIVKQVLDETEIDESRLAKDLLIKRASHWKAVEKEKRTQKMIEYLIRKGFDFEIAKSVAKSYNIGHV